MRCLNCGGSVVLYTDDDCTECKRGRVSLPKWIWQRIIIEWAHFKWDVLGKW